MANLSLEAHTRTERGRHVHALRRTGTVPAVLYGHNLEAVAIAADAKQLERIWQRAGRTHLVDLRVDGARARKVLFRAFQSDPRTGRPVHADFFAVNLREKLTADVPIVVIGESPAVTTGDGQVQQVVTHIRVECLPSDLPAQLTVDISALLEVDQGITLGEVELPKGVTLLHAELEELVVKIAQVRVTAAEDVEVPAEAGAADGEAEADDAAEPAPEEG